MTGEILLGFEVDNRDPPLLELAYWAGFFDGDGCIGIYKYQNKDRWHKSPTYSVYMALTIVDKEIVDQFAALFQGSRATRRHRTPNSQLQYYWTARGNRAVAVLTKLLPFLRLKKPQAQLALEFHARKGSNPARLLKKDELDLRENYYQQMRKMNSKGKGRRKQ
jgi:hypothetical protein